MQNPHIPGGYWSKQFPCYKTRMEQINKLIRIVESMGGLHLLTENLSLVPLE